MPSRRPFMSARLASLAAGLSACTTPPAGPLALVEPEPAVPAMPARYGPILDEPYPIPAVPEGVVPTRPWRQRVDNPFLGARLGRIVVDPGAFFLHLVEEGGPAMRYGIGAGLQGFAWSDDARLGYKRRCRPQPAHAERLRGGPARGPSLSDRSPPRSGPSMEVDRGVRRDYLRRVNRLVRIMVLVLLAAFSAGTVAHAAMAPAMAAMQAEEGARGSAASDCPGCTQDEEGVVACDVVCTPSLFAAPESDTPLPAMLQSAEEGGTDVLAVGLRAPPDPFPPRAPILS